MTLLLIMAIPAGFVLYAVAALVRKSRQRQKQRRLARAYDRIIRQNRVMIDYREIIGNRVIALDRRNKKLIVIDHSGSKEHELCISLRSIAAAKVIEQMNRQGMIEWILLELHDQKTRSVDTICFFDHSRDPVSELTLLAKKAQHWKARVEINKRPGRANIEAEFVL